MGIQTGSLTRGLTFKAQVLRQVWETPSAGLPGTLCAQRLAALLPASWTKSAWESLQVPWQLVPRQQAQPVQEKCSQALGCRRRIPGAPASAARGFPRLGRCSGRAGPRLTLPSFLRPSPCHAAASGILSSLVQVVRVFRGLPPATKPSRVTLNPSPHLPWPLSWHSSGGYSKSLTYLQLDL